MFKKFFKKEEDEEKVTYTTNVDPVLEQRRKEKFSAPLIYNDEVEEVAQKKPEVKKTPVPQKKLQQTKTYKMTEIISPMSGLKKTADEPTVKVTTPKVRKVKKEPEGLIPIISPFYGPAEYLDTKEVEEKPVKKETKKQIKKEEVIEAIIENKTEELTVENNLRNIANIVKEEQDQLRIIEERTGEFKLDFTNQTKDTFIDEIDDSMSLDELMSLYEKKFKD